MKIYVKSAISDEELKQFADFRKYVRDNAESIGANLQKIFDRYGLIVDTEFASDCEFTVHPKNVNWPFTYCKSVKPTEQTLNRETNEVTLTQKQIDSIVKAAKHSEDVKNYKTRFVTPELKKYVRSLEPGCQVWQDKLGREDIIKLQWNMRPLEKHLGVANNISKHQYVSKKQHKQAIDNYMQPIIDKVESMGYEFYKANNLWGNYYTLFFICHE